MKKRKLVLPFTITTVLACLAGLWYMSANSMGVSVGRCLAAENGAYMLILDNAPIKMSNRTNDAALFAKFDTGDKILVLHDGIQESYPGNTGVYAIFKLGDGDTGDVPQPIIDELTELGWLAAKGPEKLLTFFPFPV